MPFNECMTHRPLVRAYHELEIFVSPRASSGARGENRDKLNLTVTPTAKANLSVMASQRNLSVSELIEQIARQEINQSQSWLKGA